MKLLIDAILHARGVRYNALLSSVATWIRRDTPVLFAGGPRSAADLACKFITGQVREAQCAARAIARVERPAKATSAP